MGRRFLHRRLIQLAVLALVAGSLGLALAPSASATHMDLDNAGILTGAGSGGGPHVRLFDVSGTATPVSFFPFATGFTGGVHVAAGDFDDSNADEIFVGAGAGGGPHVKAYDYNDIAASPTGLSSVVTQTNSWFAYPKAFTGGVRVATGDLSLDGDFSFEAITGAGPGGGPHVKAWKVNIDTGTVTPTVSFMAFSNTYRGGVWVASFDATTTADADVTDEILVSRGSTSLAQIKAFNGDGTPLWSTLVFNPEDNPGSAPPSVAGLGNEMGQEGSNPLQRVFAAPGREGKPIVSVRNTGGGEAWNFLAYASGFRGGVNLGTVDFWEDGTSGALDPWIVTGAGPGGGPHVKRFDLEGNPAASFFPYSKGFTGGVFVSGGIFSDDD